MGRNSHIGPCLRQFEATLSHLLDFASSILQRRGKDRFLPRSDLTSARRAEAPSVDQKELLNHTAAYGVPTTPGWRRKSSVWG